MEGVEGREGVGGGEGEGFKGRWGVDGGVWGWEGGHSCCAEGIVCLEAVRAFQGCLIAVTEGMLSAQ